MNKKDKYHKRTLKEIDKDGRVKCVHIVHDLDAMIRDAFPELKEDYEKRQAEKLPAELITFKRPE